MGELVVPRLRSSLFQRCCPDVKSLGCGEECAFFFYEGKEKYMEGDVTASTDF